MTEFKFKILCMAFNYVPHLEKLGKALKKVADQF